MACDRLLGPAATQLKREEKQFRRRGAKVDAIGNRGPFGKRSATVSTNTKVLKGTPMVLWLIESIWEATKCATNHDQHKPMNQRQIGQVWRMGTFS